MRDEHAGEAELLERLNASSRNTLMEQLEIRYSAAGEDYLEATMPVDQRHRQPFGILHGGATAALAESVASAASALKLIGTESVPVGLELSISHLRSVRSGTVTARAVPVHLGRSTHLWQIWVRDQDERLVALAKLTVMVLDRS